MKFHCGQLTELMQLHVCCWFFFVRPNGRFTWRHLQLEHGGIARKQGTVGLVSAFFLYWPFSPILSCVKWPSVFVTCLGAPVSEERTERLLLSGFGCHQQQKSGHLPVEKEPQKRGLLLRHGCLLLLQ